MTTGMPPAPAFVRYRPDPGGWDECFAPDGSIRPAYEPFVNTLESMDPRLFERRWAEGMRAIEENGLTFHVHGDERGLERPFELDPLPLVISAAEWSRIERGVAQRARMLDRVLADVYGPRDLLRKKLVPPGVIFGHPSFLRPCVGVAVPSDARLHVYAVDLVRGPDGVFRVVADHAQTPPGAGFALENRIVISRALPEAFRAVHAQRLAGFYVHLRRTLLDLAPRHRDNPRVVLLTPGALSETYLEQAYLAQYLGFSLVQGDDLTVRDGKVFLKTLGGLEPVDVILRRLADDYADPLELRNESTLGTVGLMGAMRSGHIAIANSLGSGVVESSALLPYFDRLVAEELGEAPILPSVRATWLGDHPDPRIALESDVVIRGAYSHRGRPIDVAALDADARRALVAEVLARPHGYVAQNRLKPSTVPVWHEGTVRPRPLTLRVFAVRSGEGYVVMPGALARIGRGDEESTAFGEKGGSKDTWVITSGDVNEVSLLRPAEAPVELRRGGIDLPSRIADHLFWLGRYAERLEQLARVLRSALQAIADDADGATERALDPFVRILTNLGAPDPNGTSKVLWLIAQATDPASSLIKALRDNMRRNGSSVRDRLSSDTWRVLVSIDDLLGEGAEERDANQALGRVNDLVRACAALAGMGQENMTRGPSYRFLDLGRRIERAVFTGEMLQATVVAKNGVVEREDLEALLRIADSIITYRSRYLTTMQLAPVLDMLVTDESNPRAIAFQIERIAAHVKDLPQESRGALPTLAERLAMRLVAAVTLADPQKLVGETGTPELAALLEGFERDLEGLSEALVTAYLTHALPSRSLALAGPSVPGEP